MLIDLVQLRTFVAVAEEQHLTRAAERLHVSQSAASAHVRAVEDSLGSQLFVRTNRRLELTRAGQLLLQKAKNLLNEEALFASFARELRGKMEGNLAVSTGSDPGARIGEIVTALRAKHPLVTIDLLARPSSGARKALKSGELDVGIFLGRPVDPGFTFYELTIVHFLVAGPAAWKEKIEAADWIELAGLPWITPSASSAYSAMLAQLFGEKDLALNSVVRFEYAAQGRAALQAGAGMMLMREEHAMQGAREGHLAVSPIARAKFALSIAHQSSRKDDPLIQAFVEAARLVWPEMKLTKAHEARRESGFT